MYKQFIRRLLFQLDPEQAHHLATYLGQKFSSLPFAERVLIQRYTGMWPSLEQELAGIRFPNPVGMAAGFDKNATLIQLLRFTGFGYAEFGSITAQPSEGNSHPRLFRIPIDRGLVNRMGLNNDGAETICRRIRKIKNEAPYLLRDFVCGINIAKTHDPQITGDDAVDDYLTSYGHARTVADYLTLNVSCPNTREGKTFEDKVALTGLLKETNRIRKPDDPPLLIKFSPDTDPYLLEELVSLCEDYRVDGYVLSNTSTGRDGLRTPESQLKEIGPGGLSGAPLFRLNLKRITRVRSIISPGKIIIGCGGVDSPEKAVQMLKAGANLIQLYTGFIYEGPSLIPEINDRLSEEVSTGGFSSLIEWLQLQHKEIPAG